MGHIASVDIKVTPPAVVAAVGPGRAAQPGARTLADSSAAITIADMPAPRRSLNDAAVHDMVAAAVGEVIRSDAAGVTSSASPADEAPADASNEYGAGDRLDEVVVAAHDQRIAMLRQRIDAMCSTEGAAPVLADLTTRLHRAEAARRLALARAGAGASSLSPGQPTPIGFNGCDARRDRPLPASIVKTTRASVAALRRPALRWKANHPAPPPFQTTLAALRVVPAPAFRDRHMGLAHPGRSHMFTAAYGGHSYRHSHHALNRRTSVRLARARRALTRARAALDGPAAAPTLRASDLPIRWWRWQGSERWLLRAAPASVNGGA